MTVLKSVPINSAPDPTPGWFIGWCLKSNFSWIKNAATNYRQRFLINFRREEVLAVNRALAVQDTIRALTRKETPATLKAAQDYLRSSIRFFIQEIKLFPEVKRILSDSVFNLARRQEKRREQVSIPDFHDAPVNLFTKKRRAVSPCVSWTGYEAVEVFMPSAKKTSYHK